MAQVSGAPGYADFEADVIMHIPSAAGGMVYILGDPETKEIFVINEQYVTED